MSAQPLAPTPVHLVRLGCARNDVDAEELAARLEIGGFRLVDEPSNAAAVVVNTCGFVESAKKDSIDTIFAAADLKADSGVRAVVAVGCLAERYGDELAESLPEADAVLGFDDYPDIAGRLRRVLDGERLPAHRPRDRRRLLPISPADRPAAVADVAVPGHGFASRGLERSGPASGPRVPRRRLGGGPSAPLKIASGCDRRCTFCAIPAFRGAFISRPVNEVVAEARWLADQGVRELFLVSENTTSYGKDLGDLRSLERLLGELAGVSGIEWIRVSYLQPAELRPGLIDVLTQGGPIVPYFDLSFQHAAPAVLRRMRRFGDPDVFLALLARIRERAPEAGIRSNVICGFPGETSAELAVLIDFLAEARLDAIGVFGYSDEDGTAAAALDGHVDPDEIEERRNHVSDVVDELIAARAAERVGSRVRVLVEEPGVGRAAHQGPEVDGSTELTGVAVPVGQFVDAIVTHSAGADLVATVGRG